MKYSTLALALLLGTVGVAGYSAAQDANTKPDNTAVNKRDHDDGELTADQQKEDALDRRITKNIRKAIVSDKTLSTYAHNVKIISRKGLVTLKGPVRSDDEKKSVILKAAAVAGRDKITDEISVTDTN